MALKCKGQFNRKHHVAFYVRNSKETHLAMSDCAVNKVWLKILAECLGTLLESLLGTNQRSLDCALFFC